MALYDSILITGGRGMLAGALQRSLHARAKTPVLLGRDELDITNADAVRQAFERLRPTLVLNCAAYTKVDHAEHERARADDVNGLAVGTLESTARDFGSKLVHYSTDFVFDGTKTQPYTIADPTNPQSAYGASKLLGEQSALKNPDALVVRTAWLYGPGGPCFPRTMVELARQKKPLTVVSDQIGSPTFTYDLAEATLRLLDAGARGIYHVVNQGSVSWFDFTHAILEEFDEKTQFSPIASADWRRQRPNSAMRPAYSVLDVSAYEQTTGHRMRPWRQALREYRLEVARGGF
jgi:dTDP-4-dehydrorhamnose reductase